MRYTYGPGTLPSDEPFGSSALVPYVRRPDPQQRNTLEDVIDVTAVATPPRRAGQMALGAMEKLGLADAGKLRYGRLAGLGTLAALLAAAGKLNDPNESAGRNLAQATGSALGGIGGGISGAIAGQMMLPMLPGVGAILGATIGSQLIGAPSGEALANVVMDAMDGGPEAAAIRQIKAQAAAALDIEADRFNRLMPLQDQAAKLALANEVSRAKQLADLQNDMVLRQSMMDAMRQQQIIGAQQQGMASQAILGALNHPYAAGGLI